MLCQKQNEKMKCKQMTFVLCNLAERIEEIFIYNRYQGFEIRWHQEDRICVQMSGCGLLGTEAE